MKYDVDYFIAKFEAIPDEKWITNRFVDSADRHCAYGHCGSWHSTADTDQSEALFQTFYRFKMSAVDVNDGNSDSYQQPTPRARILAALADIKAKQPTP